MTFNFKEKIANYIDYARNLNFGIIPVTILSTFLITFKEIDNFKIMSWRPPPGSVLYQTKSIVQNIGYKGPYLILSDKNKYILVHCEPWPPIDTCLKDREKFQENKTYDITYIDAPSEHTKERSNIIMSIASGGNVIFNSQDRITYIRQTYVYSGKGSAFRGEYGIGLFIYLALYTSVISGFVLFFSIFPLIIKLFNIRITRNDS